MPLTIDTTFGGEQANAYVAVADVVVAGVTVAGVDTLLREWVANRALRKSWLNETDEELKKAAIVSAARNIDSRRWQGWKWFRYQSLQFPRAIPTSGTDYDYGSHGGSAGTEFLSTVASNKTLALMKQRVELANAIQAAFLLSIGGEDAHREMQFRGVGSWSRGQGFSESASYFGPAKVLHPDAMDQLRYYRASGPRVVRGGGHSGVADTPGGDWWW